MEPPPRHGTALEQAVGRIMVTGGAGYVGSHVVRELVRQGESVVVLDDLTTGHRQAVAGVQLVQADFAVARVLDEQLAGGAVEFIVHMAASAEVGESVADPAKYYRNNLAGSLALLEAARRHRVGGLVFSSSAAVYGEPESIPIQEEHPQRPTHPYGETKLALERALAWYHRAYGLRYVALRYFNAAGAHLDGDLGEDHSPESHLVPRLIRSVLEPDRPTPVWGEDYPTRDGTCVRDYVHVADLARAHALAIGAMRRGDLQGAALNLGNEAGFTVREVVEAVAQVAGTRPVLRSAPRRPGDPAVLVACSARARLELGWRPADSSLTAIVGSAWDWHRRHPHGFGDREAER